ncbi:MAG: hypothetical protein A3G36_05480 [Omnitrophica bacterium RIFCSPLOWO2_12_FULL_45_13]|nr:MAG: hypothetical protein A3G36_05480 [Omnitrophica bacterium RIFCSPLOWO2_12_FULL_45_13]
MQDKKFLTLIVLAIFAVISLIYGSIAVHPKGRKDHPAPQAGSLTPHTVYISAERRAKRSEFKSWKRNPFVPVGGAPIPANLILSGIIWNKENPKAVIGDAIVAKGGKISGNTVLDIQQDRVILTDGTKDFELKL